MVFPKQVDGGLVLLAEPPELLQRTVDITGRLGVRTRQFPFHQQRIVAVEGDGQFRFPQQLAERLGILLVAGKSCKQRPAAAISAGSNSLPDEGQYDGAGNLVTTLLQIGNLDPQGRSTLHLLLDEVGGTDVVDAAVLGQSIAQHALAAGWTADYQDDGTLRLHLVGRGGGIRKVAVEGRHVPSICRCTVATPRQGAGIVRAAPPMVLLLVLFVLSMYEMKWTEK